MSISSEISRISQNVSNSLSAVAAKGVSVPSGSTSDNLPTLISSINTGQLEPIGKATISLSEYTDTTTTEQTDTGINISNTDYAFGFVVVTCDSPITTSKEWGMTIANFGRYTSNSALMYGVAIQQKGSATLSRAAMANNSLSQNSYGVSVLNNTSNVVVARKCHETACPKCRGGNYTIAVFGVKSL